MNRLSTNRIIFAYDIPRRRHAVAQAALRLMSRIRAFRMSYSCYLILKNRWKLVLLPKLIKKIRACGGIVSVSIDGGDGEPP